MKTETVMHRDEQVSNIRVLAILLVVLGHSIILYSNSWNIYRPLHQYLLFALLKKVVDTIQMPLFFSISGYLLPRTLSHKNITFKKFVVNKARRLLAPFCFVAMVWMIPIKLAVRYPGYSGKSYFQILVDVLLDRDSGHLWFLPTLFIIFIMLWPVCRKLASRTQILWMLILTFGVHLIFQNGVHIWYISRALGYCFWCVLGFAIYKYKNHHSHLRRAAQYLLFVGFIIGELVYLMLPVDNLLMHILGICLADASSVLFVCWIYLAGMPNRSNTMIGFLDRNSFGLYLFHSPLVYITYTYGSCWNPWAVLLVNFFVMGGIALTLTALLKRTPLRIALGERYKL